MNFSFYQKWIDILLHKTKPADIAGTSLGSGLKHLVVSGVIVGVLAGLINTIFGVQGGAVSIITLGISIPVGYIIGTLIYGGILWVVAKVLGGTGSYGNYVGTLSIISGALNGTAFALITVLQKVGEISLITPLIQIVGILTIIMTLYAIYLAIKTTQAVHNVSMLKAVLIVIIPLVLIAIVAIAAVGAALSAVLGAGSGLI